MADKLMYIPYNNTQNYPSYNSWLKHLDTKLYSPTKQSQ